MHYDARSGAGIQLIRSTSVSVLCWISMETLKAVKIRKNIEENQIILHSVCHICSEIRHVTPFLTEFGRFCYCFLKHALRSKLWKLFLTSGFSSNYLQISIYPKLFSTFAKIFQHSAS